MLFLAPELSRDIRYAKGRGYSNYPGYQIYFHAEKKNRDYPASLNKIRREKRPDRPVNKAEVALLFGRLPPF
jgi:hypothetical protein